MNTDTPNPNDNPRQNAPTTNLEFFRKRAGYTQCELARLLNVSQAAISKAHHKPTSISSRKWDILADLFGVDPRVLKGTRVLV